MADIYPFSVHRISFAERDHRPNEFDPLISAILPSFENLKAAVLHYIYDLVSDREFSVINDLTLQLHEKDCWISKISLHPTAITVDVKGTNVSGARLEVRMDRDHFEKRINRSVRNVFTLTKGLGDKLWIVVSRKGKWIDYHETNLKYRSYSGNKEDQLISYLDKRLELEAIVARGEGETTEFKFEVSETTETTNLMRSVCAFANTDGGVIVVGVEDRTGRIVGIKGNVNREKDRLTQIIRGNLTHSPRIKIDRHELAEVSVLVVEVTKGENPPYGIKRDKPSYYVRRGATNVAASPEEMRLLVANQNGAYPLMTAFRA
ncbi:MAG TPA: hypothetical protein DEP46_07575 [Blastocatellia bacterium]|nr:hypothetical protein [Blastocatellia bacterium]